MILLNLSVHAKFCDICASSDYVSFEVLREFALDKDEADQRLDDLNEQRERLKKLL